MSIIFGHIEQIEWISNKGWLNGSLLTGESITWFNDENSSDLI